MGRESDVSRTFRLNGLSLFPAIELIEVESPHVARSAG